MADINPAAKIAEIFRPTIFEADIFGFKPASVTIEKAAAKEEKKDAVAAAVEAPTEAAAAAINKGAEYETLRPGESLWDEGMSRRRLHNIVGGWV
jgi:actin-like ATPase involved in cell morphogenesis